MEATYNQNGMVLKREQFNLEQIAKENFGYKAKVWFTVIISIILITDLATLFDIPFLRQVFGFVFLTILPGLLILQILKLNKIDLLEKFILAWGISISFLLLFGLLVNSLSLSLGYETPLATVPLLISFNLAFILLAIKTFGKSFIKSSNLEEVGSIGLKSCLPKFNLSTSEKAFLIVPVMFPALSIFGMHLMNTTDNNIILMFLLFLIAIYVVFVCFSNRKFPKKLYPIVIFSISISLVLLLSLRSNHLLGADVHLEYYFFLTTLDNLHRSMSGYHILNACLSISLLPTIYQSILNVHPEYLYKILPSVLCSIFPVIIYFISRKYVEEGYAFLASMYFISNATFLWTEFNARANIAMLFFAFAMMTLFNDRIELLKKRILFVLFMVSCMVSHYTSTYIFFFVMLGTFIGIEVLSKKYKFKNVVSSTFMALFFALIFFWYSQVTETAFNIGVRFIEDSFDSLYNFAVIEARSEPAQLLLGKGDLLQESIVFKIQWLLTWLTFAFIGIGIVTVIIRFKEMSFPERNVKKPDFLKAKFEVGYFILSLILSGLLVVMVLIPFLSKGYGLGRSYPIASTILSVFFVIGGIVIAKTLSLNNLRKILSKILRGKKALLKKPFSKKESFTKRSLYLRNSGKNRSQVRAYFIILLVLIPYFLCITGAMYNIFGYPYAITLNSEGRQYDRMYIHDQYLIAGEWSISSEIVEGRLVNKQKRIGNMTEYLGMFDEKNRIYDNGGSEVWR